MRTFGERRELRPFHTYIGAVAHHADAFALAASAIWMRSRGDTGCAIDTLVTQPVPNQALAPPRAIDQFVDRTFSRQSSFFGTGCVAHVSMAHPVSPRLRIDIAEAAMAEDIAVVRDGTYVCMEGP